MLVAAACCPHPPVLVPEVAGAAAPELDAVRGACGVAIRRLYAARPNVVAVVGEGSATTRFDETSAGTLAGYGADVRVGGGPSARAVLPLSLTMGRWLLDAADLSGRPDKLRLYSVAPETPLPRLLRLGAELASAAPRVALLAMGDGSAARAVSAPGHTDTRARGLDTAATRALADGEPDALLRLGTVMSSEVRATGRGPWLVLAGAAHGTTWAAELHAEAAPYGVTYLVASWVASEPGRGGTADRAAR